VQTPARAAARQAMAVLLVAQRLVAAARLALAELLAGQPAARLAMAAQAPVAQPAARLALAAQAPVAQPAARLALAELLVVARLARLELPVRRALAEQHRDAWASFDLAAISSRRSVMSTTAARCRQAVLSTPDHRLTAASMTASRSFARTRVAPSPAAGALVKPVHSAPKVRATEVFSALGEVFATGRPSPAQTGRLRASV
jgi:hypothetical protein